MKYDSWLQPGEAEVTKLTRRQVGRTGTGVCEIIILGIQWAANKNHSYPCTLSHYGWEIKQVFAIKSVHLSVSENSSLLHLLWGLP